MCGICGIVDPAGKITEEMLKTASDRMLKRGPDAGGVWLSGDRVCGLGHRRLSIIDLDPRSNQPFISDDGRIALTYNGEIYNFKDIKQALEAKGHHFRTASDTEMIVHAYQEWGLECVQHFRGMFAFGIVDTLAQRVWLVRDRFGKKPLLYYHKDEMLAFASDFGALTELPFVDRQLDLTALYDCLTYNYIPAPKTAYQYIRKLGAGEWLLWENGLLRTETYWDVRNFSEIELPQEQAIERLRELMDEATRLRLMSDVPLGVLLSGGLDSSAVAYYAAKNSLEPIHTFSMGFDVQKFDELHHAEMMAQAIQSNHVAEVYGFERARDDMQNCMHVYGEPHGDSSIFPTVAVSRVAKRHVTVALAGDGGDELFWGYRHFLSHAQHEGKGQTLLNAVGKSFVRTAVPIGARGRNFLLRRFTDEFELHCALMGGLAREDKLRLISDDVRDQIGNYDDYWFWRKYWKPELPLGTRLQYLDLKTYLVEGVLMKVDRAAMSVSLETRTPLLDHKLVEEVFSWHESVRSDGKTLKYIFRKAMAGILPETILNKPKQGFSIPWRQWMKNWDEMRKVRGRGLFYKKGLMIPPLYTALVIQDWLRVKTKGRFA
jgi:asparagine synthase (glutamine-hydrolysing)